MIDSYYTINLAPKKKKKKEKNSFEIVINSFDVVYTLLS